MEKRKRNVRVEIRRQEIHHARGLQRMSFFQKISVQNHERHQKPKAQRRIRKNQQNGPVGGRRQASHSGRWDTHAGPRTQKILISVYN